MFVFLEDRFCDETEAVIPFKNRGMYFGEGLFETMRTYNGVVFEFERHFLRLTESANYFSLPISFSIDDLKTIIRTLLAKNNLDSAIVRITLVGGELQLGEPFVHPPLRSILFIETKPFHQTFRGEVSLHFSPSLLAGTDELRKHKTTNYMRNLLVLRSLAGKEFEEKEIIFSDEHNYLLEGARTNLFLVIYGVVVTPSLDCGILPGITRSLILDMCKELQIQCEERIVHRSAIHLASEMFVTNSVSGITGVTDCEGKAFTQNTITSQLQSAYNERVKGYR